MLRDRLKNMDLRITELSNYLRVSRPTMYKYIEYYDSAKFDLINKDTLALFNYIAENELVGKRNVITYILTNTLGLQGQEEKTELYAVNAIRNLLINNPESKRSRFITDCFLNDMFNDVICYLSDVSLLMQKKRLSDKEKKKIEPYKNLQKEILHLEDK